MGLTLWPLGNHLLPYFNSPICISSTWNCTEYYLDCVLMNEWTNVYYQRTFWFVIFKRIRNKQCTISLHYLSLISSKEVSLETIKNVHIVAQRSVLKSVLFLWSRFISEYFTIYAWYVLMMKALHMQGRTAGSITLKANWHDKKRFCTHWESTFTAAGETEPCIFILKQTCSTTTWIHRKWERRELCKGITSKNTQAFPCLIR